MTHSSLLEIVLSEGKNREIRRILAKVGHKVLRLKRIAIGPVRLAQLPSGDFRPMSPEEFGPPAWAPTECTANARSARLPTPDLGCVRPAFARVRSRRH